MGQIVISRWRGATGDVAHRPSVASCAKWQVVPPGAALPRPVASLRGLARAPTSRGTARLAGGPRERGQTDPIRSENALGTWAP